MHLGLETAYKAGFGPFSGTSPTAQKVLIVIANGETVANPAQAQVSTIVTALPDLYKMFSFVI